MPGVLQIYSITYRPKDLPGTDFAVREFLVDADGAHLGRLVGTAPTLEAARALVPAHADHRMPRSVDDDEVIIETWI